MSDASKQDRMPTGIPGLDRLLEGGLVRGNSLLVEGPPGSGKTTFGVRIIAEGVLQYDEPGLMITFEEFPKQIYQESLGYGIDLAALEATGKMRVIWTPPGRILEGFKGKNDLIEKIISEMGIKRIIIDSITHFKRIAESETQLRETLCSILNYLKIRGITAIMVKELERMDTETIAFEEYLVDASMRVYNKSTTEGRDNVRMLEVRKTRGQGHISGRHPFVFTKKGLTVYPRLRPKDVAATQSARAEGERTRISTGITGLNSMLAGGLWKGSRILVNGFPGTGKSVIGYHFIDAGLRAKEPCTLLNIQHSSELTIDQAASLGMNWREAVDTGLLRIFSFHPVGLCLEELQHELLEDVRLRGVQRIVTDSIDTIRSAIGEGDRVRDHLQVMSSVFQNSGTTSLMLNETAHMGGSADGSNEDYSNLASTVIQLSMAETGGEVRRFLGIRKHAGSDHAKELREVRIDGSGLSIERKASGLSGILTGQTQGTMTNLAEEVLPPLEGIGEVFRALLERAELGEDAKKSLRSARGQLGLVDVLLREHFGVTDFQKIAADMVPGVGSPE